MCAWRGVTRRGVAWWVIVFGLLLGQMAAPAVAAVGVNKSFSPNLVSVGQASTATVTLYNPNASDATGTSITDTLPTGLVVANPANASTTCSGTVTATSGGGAFSLSGGTIPAASGTTSGSCTVSVNVVANTATSYTNTVPAGAVSSSQGSNTSATQVSLTVAALVPFTGSKSFSPGYIHGGSSTLLTITVQNPNASALSNVSFTDTLPTGVVIATPNNLNSTCGGAVSGTNTVGLNGATIAGNSICTITVNVTAASPNVYANSTITNTIAAGSISSAQGVTNTSALSSNVYLRTGARVVKSFSPTTLDNGASGSLTLTVENYDTTALTAIFTDTLNAALTNPSINTATTTCPGVSLSGSVLAMNGTVAAAPTSGNLTSCVIQINFTASNLGSSVATAPNVAANFSGINFSNSLGTVTPSFSYATLTINPTGALSLSKTLTGSAAQTGLISATITFINNTGLPASIASFTDNLTTMGTGFTVGGATSNTCGATVTAPVGGTTISIVNSGTVPANGSCSLTVPIAIAANASTGTRTNTISTNQFQAVINGTTQRNLAPATASIVNYAALTLSKSFSPTTIASGLQRSTLTITLNRAAGAASLTGLTFTDNLPTSPYAMIVEAGGLISNTCGGTVTAVPGTGAVVLTGGTLAAPVGGAASSCSIKVYVTAPAGSDGTDTNTLATGSVANNQGVTSGTASATLAAHDESLTLAKGFNPLEVSLNGTSRLTLTIANTSAGAIALTGVTLTDNLPTGMVIAAPPNPTFTGTGCTGGTLTATANTSLFKIANASITANSTCSLSVNVTAKATGNLINQVGTNAITTNQGITNLFSTTATLSASGTADVAVIKTDSSSTATAGGTTVYTVTATNNGPDPVAGVSVTDTPPTGVTFTSWTCVGANSGVCSAASGSGAINELVTLPAVGASVTYTVTAQLSSNLTGNITNTATGTVPGMVVDPVPGNNSATDTDTTARHSNLSITKSDSSSTYLPGGTATYDIVVSNSGPSDAAAITVTDTLPADVTLAETPTCTAAGTATCGTLTGVAGDTAFSATGASIPVGTPHTLTYHVPVRFASSLTTTPLINTATASISSDPTASKSATDTNTRSAVANLKVTKAANPIGTYLPGQPITYAITVTNSGPSDAADIGIVDAVPEEVTVSDWNCTASGSGADCDSTVAGTGASGSGNTVNLAHAVLPVDTQLTVLVNGTVKLATTEDVVNTVDVSLPTSVGCATASCTSSATVTNSNAGTPQLTLTKTATPTAFAVGQPGTYALLIGNTGTSSTAGTITVTDPLPTGITATALPVGTGWDCSASTSTLLSCTSSTVLLPGANAPVITVNVTTATGTTSPAHNVARVSGGGDSGCPIDSTLDRCQVTLDTPINSPVLNISKLLGSDLVVNVPNRYVITVTNVGQAATLAGSITDVMPTGLTLGTLPSDCTAVGQAVTCTIPAGLIPGASLSFTLPVTPQASVDGQALSNRATVQGGGDASCPTEAHCSSTVNDTVTSPQLVLGKTITGAFVAGQPASYILTVTNIGTAPVQDDPITITDTLPGGLSLGTLPAGCTTASEQILLCTVTQLPINATVSFSIPVTPSADLIGQSLTNDANATEGDDPGCATGTPVDALPDRCKATVTVAVSAPQLTLSKLADVPFAVGVQSNFTLRVTNIGGATSFGELFVSDLVPASLTLGTLPTGCSASGQQLSCSSGTALAPGASLDFVIPVTPDSTAVPSVTNVATVWGGGDPTCPVTANCTASILVSVNAPQLSISKSSNGPWSHDQAGTAYTLVIQNQGAAATSGVVTVVDALPAGITPDWSGMQTIGLWSCTASGQILRCTGTPNIAASGSASLVIPVVVVASGSTTVVNEASVGGGDDPFNGGNTPDAGASCWALDSASPGHCASDTTTITGTPAVTVAKMLASATQLPLVAGQTITYVLTATNTSTVAITAYTINEVVPINTTFVAATHGTANAATTCTAGDTAGTLCTVSFDTVPAGGSATVLVTFRVIANVTPGTSVVVNAITAPITCWGSTCDPSTTLPQCSGNQCTPQSGCTTNDDMCVASDLASDAATPLLVPTLHPVTYAGLMLMLLLGGLGKMQARRQKTRRSTH